jgi:hypothetical protein
MKYSNTNPAAAQAFALALAGIAAATSHVFYSHPASFVAAVFRMALAAMRAQRALDAERGL